MSEVNSSQDGNSVNSFPAEVLQEAILDLLNPGGWIQVPKVLLHIMDIPEAVLLAYLIGVCRKVDALKRNEGWFYHTHLQIEDGINLNRNKQNPLIDNLKKSGLLETKRVGMPAKRYFRISPLKIWERVSKAQKEASLLLESQQHVVPPSQQHVVPPSQQLPKTRSTRLDEKDTRGHVGNGTTGEEPSVARRNPASSPGLPSVRTLRPSAKEGEKAALHKDGFAVRCAKQLIQILQAHNKLMEEEPSSVRWSHQFQALLKKRTKTQIEEMLQWYSANITWQFTPKVRCARTFLLRFADLEEAVERRAKSTQGTDKLLKPSEMSEMGCRVWEQVGNHQWPKGAGALLPAAIEESLKNYKEFHRQVRNTTNPKLRGFVDYLLARWGSTGPFVTRWYDDLFERVAFWKGWAGKPTVVTITAKEFQAKGRAMADEYGKSNLWQKLLEELEVGS